MKKVPAYPGPEALMKTISRGLPYLSSGITLFLVLFFACSAGGEEKLVLGLPQVISMAIEKSPEIAETKSEIAAARSELAQADAAYYPQFDTIALAGPINNARQPAVHGTRIVDPSPDLSVGVFGRIDMTLTQPLYTFGKISNRRDAAAGGVAVREAKLPRKKNEIALRVKEIYYGLVLARAGVLAARDAVGYFDEARRRMDRLLELGSQNVLESDLYRIDAYRADTTRSLVMAEEGMKTAYFALKSMIRMPAGTDFEPADTMLSVSGQTLGDLDEYIRTALSGRPEFKQLEQALRAQKSSVEGAISDTYPSFFAALAGSFAGAPGRETFHNSYIPDQFNHATGGIVSGMKWHFDFGILKARIEKERADYDKLLHTKAVAELGIPIEVTQRYHEVREWRAAVDAYERAVSSSRKWIVAALTNFDMGVGTADDLLRSIERYGQNRGKYLEALFNYNMSLARLEYAMGVQTW
jgi:outer membrane protein